MTRATQSVVRRRRHRKLLQQAKGYRGRNKNVYRIALEKVEKALRYAYRDRRNRKRDFRCLWIQRINAGVREYGMTYGVFIHGLKREGIDLDRKALAELAAYYPGVFREVVERVRRGDG